MGILFQAREVWVTKKADLLPYPAFIGQLGLFCVSSIYGFHYGLLALILIGVPRACTVMYLLIGMNRVKPWEGHDKWFAVITLVLIGLAFYPPIALGAMVLISAYGFFYFGKIPYTMWKSKSKGSVSLKAQFMLIIAHSIWAVYGFILGDLLIALTSLLILLIPITTAGIWLYIEKTTSNEEKGHA